MTSWRLLDTGARSGSVNMAIDEALFTGVISGNSPSTIRFFTWEPACLSLGFRQKAGVRLLAACRRYKVEVVRRPTGGLAVLHGEDLCYSVTTRLGEGSFPAALQQAILKINHALCAGLRLLGLPAEVTVASGYLQAGQACAGAVSLYEVTVYGKKIIGSAQLFSNGCLLQHGSLALDFNPAALLDVVGMASEGADKLAEKATGLKQAARRLITASEAAAVLREGFVTVLGVSLMSGGLTTAEGVAAKKLAVKYRAFRQQIGARQ